MNEWITCWECGKFVQVRRRLGPIHRCLSKRERKAKEQLEAMIAHLHIQGMEGGVHRRSLTVNTFNDMLVQWENAPTTEELLRECVAALEKKGFEK